MGVDRQPSRIGLPFSPVARRGQRPAVSDRWERSGARHNLGGAQGLILFGVFEVRNIAIPSQPYLADC